MNNDTIFYFKVGRYFIKLCWFADFYRRFSCQIYYEKKNGKWITKGVMFIFKPIALIIQKNGGNDGTQKTKEKNKS